MRDYQYDQEILNESGQRHGTLVLTSYLYDSLAYSHIYNNGTLIETTDYRFQIGNEKELVGKYKEGMPNEGYFVYENEFEIPEIDYYEKGVFQTKYTTTIMAMLEVEMTGIKPKMIKSIYKDQKLWQGLNHKGYKMDGSSLLATEYYENGVITNVDLWILAMHYAELIKVKFLPNGYEIYNEGKNDPEGDPKIDKRPARIIIQFTDEENGTFRFSLNEILISKYQFWQKPLSQGIKPFPGIISYALNGSGEIEITQKTNFEAKEDKNQESFNENLITLICKNFLYASIPKLNPNSENDYSLLFKNQNELKQENLLFQNEEGKPVFGLYLEEKNGFYSYLKYKEGKSTDKKEKLTIQEIKKSLFQN